MVDLIGDCANHRFTGKTLEELQHLLVAAGADTAPPAPTLRIRDIKRRLGSKAIEQLVTDYEAGSSTIQLMKRYEISKSSVLKLLREGGVTMRPSTHDLRFRGTSEFVSG